MTKSKKLNKPLGLFLLTWLIFSILIDREDLNEMALKYFSNANFFYLSLTAALIMIGIAITIILLYFLIKWIVKNKDLVKPIVLLIIKWATATLFLTLFAQELSGEIYEDKWVFALSGVVVFFLMFITVQIAEYRKKRKLIE